VTVRHIGPVIGCRPGPGQYDGVRVESRLRRTSSMRTGSTTRMGRERDPIAVRPHEFFGQQTSCVTSPNKVARVGGTR
jgi:hypothetical protein